MAVRPILRMGEPSLMAPSVALSNEMFASAELQALLDDMQETMIAAHGACVDQLAQVAHQPRGALH